MKRLLPLLLLAGCAGGVINEALPREPGPDAAACREEAIHDPEARRVAASAAAGNPAQEDRVRRQWREVLRRRYDACMIRRGARSAGGVEPVRPSWW